MNSDQAKPEFKRAPEMEDRIMEMHTAAMREMSEPRDGIRPTPVLFLIICFLFTMWGGYYMGTYAGDWTGNGLSERAAGPAAAGPSAPQNPMVLGAEVYNACTQCHQADGKGLAGQFPPLADSEYVNGDVRRLAAILVNGINGELVVKGQTYNSQMPAWKDNYNDEEIAAVHT
jgi:mono/diheme cytochrome c family protein